MEQCIKGKLRIQAIKDGIDMGSMDTEFYLIGEIHKEAERIVRKRRGWLKNFFIVLWEEFPIPRLEYINPEVQREWDRLIKTNKELHKLRPDLY